MASHDEDVRRSGSMQYKIESDEDVPVTANAGTQTCNDDWVNKIHKETTQTLKTLHNFSRSFERLSSMYKDLSSTQALKTDKEDKTRDYNERGSNHYSYERKYYNYRTSGSRTDPESWYPDQNRQRCYPDTSRRHQRRSSERNSESNYSYSTSRQYKDN